jgi:AcrR family transcriptional regulator
MDTGNKRDVKSDILDATDRLLARYGYKKMTIDDLARETGIGKGSVYLHFSSKQEIALSHIDRIVDRLTARLRVIAAKDSAPDERLAEMLVERVVFRFKSVQHYTESINELLASIRPALLERRKTHFETEANILAAVIREGIAKGTMHDVAAFKTAMAMLTATNSLLPFSLSIKELGKLEEIRGRAEQTARLLIYGLVTRNES